MQRMVKVERKLNLGDLVQVVWQDTTVEHDYVSLKVALDQTIATMSTVGNFVSQDKDSIRIALTRCLDKDIIDCVATIPMSCVLQVNKLSKE